MSRIAQLACVLAASRCTFKRAALLFVLAVMVFGRFPAHAFGQEPPNKRVATMPRTGAKVLRGLRQKAYFGPMMASSEPVGEPTMNNDNLR